MSDTTPRDQLTELVAKTPVNDEGDTLDDSYWDVMPKAEMIANAILAAGFRPPAHVVSTVEELDALAMGTVIMEGDHGTPDDTGWGFKTMPCVFHRFPEGWHVVAGIGEHAPDLPATVLWEPEEGE